MPDTLEQRLSKALRDVPAAPPDGAREAALAALPTGPAPRGRRRRRLVLALAVCAAAMLVSAVTLYASPEARQAVGIETYHPTHPFPPGPKRLQLPTGATGIAVLADGRMWATARALNLTAVHASAVELSPNGLNLAVGRGRDLVAIRTDGSGERVLRHTEGRVVAISWAPNPIRIAYIVQVGGRYRLHLIEGDGDHDVMVDGAVAPVRPSWRADTEALAYISAGGRVVVRNLVHDRATVLPRDCLGGAATHVAWSPLGATLAATGPGGVAILSPTRSRCAFPFSGVVIGYPPEATGLIWSDAQTLVVAAGRNLSRFHWNGRALAVVGRPVERRGAPIGIAGLPDGRLVVSLSGHRLRMLEVDATTLHIHRMLLDAPPVSGNATVSLR